MRGDNHFFVDGSALLGDIKRVRASDPNLSGKKLSLVKLAEHFTGEKSRRFLGTGFRRFTYYFVSGDSRIENELILPDFHVADAVEDLRIEYCGKTIPAFKKAHQWLDENSAPKHVRDCVYRSEKAVDTQLCCDALQLAAVGKLDRLFLYSNDYDFVPLCRALRHLGLNINLFRLSDDKTNKELAKEVDAVQQLSAEELQSCFVDPSAAT